MRRAVGQQQSGAAVPGHQTGQDQKQSAQQQGWGGQPAQGHPQAQSYGYPPGQPGYYPPSSQYPAPGGGSPNTPPPVYPPQPAQASGYPPGPAYYPPGQQYPGQSGYSTGQQYPGQSGYSTGQQYPGYPPSGQPYPGSSTPLPQSMGDRPGYDSGQVKGPPTSKSRDSQIRMSLPEIGEVLAGRYEILSELGVGGFGAVYKAHQRGLNKEVAVKVLLPAAASIEGAAARFRREAMLAKELSHPNTIQLYDYGQTEDGLTFIAMELLDGHELEEELKNNGPMPAERVKRIATQVLKSLSEAHAHGIVHRDLKPSNIMLVDVFGESDFVKVLDFGIARAFADHQEDFKTRTGTIIGTPQYMSPEQLRGEDIGPHTDLYAMGLIMAEMLTGKPVFHGENTNLIIVAQLSPGDPPIQEEVMRSPLGSVIRRATTKSLARRFKTAIEMLKTMDRAEPLTSSEYRAVVEEVAGPQAVKRPPSGQIAAEAPPRPQPVEKKRSRLVPALLVLLLLAGAGVTGALLLTNRSSGPSIEGTAGSPSTSSAAAAGAPLVTSEQLAAMDQARIFGQEAWRTANRICMVGGETSTSPTGQVRLMLLTNQPGARVYRGNTYLGTTPFNAEVAAGSNAENITVRLEGYRDATVTVDLTQPAMPDTVNLVPIERERVRERERTTRERETPAATSTQGPSRPPRQPAQETARQQEPVEQQPPPTPVEPSAPPPPQRPSIGLIDDFEDEPPRAEPTQPSSRDRSTRSERSNQEAEEPAEEEPAEEEPAEEEPAPTIEAPPTPPTQGGQETEVNIPILF
ncbi:MAG: serine/threonine protein kinase [Bradymonadales bacterium]|nr:serine/threonine protein kinase [Bradymonadales bacterium]